MVFLLLVAVMAKLSSIIRRGIDIRQQNSDLVLVGEHLCINSFIYREGLKTGSGGDL